MILLILGIGFLGLYISFITMHRSTPRSICVAIFGAVALGALLLVTLNDTRHFGMEEQTITTKQKIYSPSPSGKVPLLLYQKTGTNGKHAVYIYQTKAKGKTVHTKADVAVQNKIKQTTTKNPLLIEKRTEWRYKSDFYRILFAGENEREFIRQTNTFVLPDNWSVLTTAQAKKLAQKLKALQKPTAAQQQALQEAVAARLSEAKAAEPAMSAAEESQLTKKITAEIETQMIEAAIKEVKEAH
ncbi:MAG: DUF4811 domain-containing protein [Enterococcaceae bacterium]|jgi:hypothetical protein|nr:DUF4811 domain-containing protein [Enterococcaceae bacterium]MCI1918684.1 DUF4811 domain-containing protein [Enterococcaceae bacterium]